MKLKIVFAALAALCTLQVLSALPTQAVDGDLKGAALGEVVHKAEELLYAVEGKVAEGAAQLQEKAKEAAEQVEQQVQGLADQLDADLMEWTAKAEVAGVDVAACLPTQAFQELLSNLHAQADRCAKDKLEWYIEIPLEGVKALIPSIAQRLLEDTKEAVAECRASEGVVATVRCAAQKGLSLLKNAGELSILLTLLNAMVARGVVLLVPETLKCVSKPLQDSTQKGVILVKEAVSCIQGQLGGN